jgi:hypothetical protein
MAEKLKAHTNISYAKLSKPCNSIRGCIDLEYYRVVLQ